MGSFNTNTGSVAAVSQRFEAKYLINELMAQTIRDHIRPFVQADGHGQEYPVTSIYLDSDNLDLYLSSVRGEERRYKLRIRTYTAGGEETCFFEVKHRHNQIIRKERAVVYNAYVDRLLQGEAPRPEMLVNPDGDMKNLLSFCRIRDALDASPRVVVRYMREAFLGRADEPLRITFDRDLMGLPSGRFDPEGWLRSPHWNDGVGPPIVMEVKFTDTYPCWVGDMIQRFDLLRESFAKYVVCVDALRNEGVRVDGSMEGFAAWIP
jgi:hypothetical protein